MYHFSRAIYRELAPYVLREKLSSQCESNQQRVLRECEAAIERLVIDHRHFARPASTLFASVRVYFSMRDLSLVYKIIERNVEAARAFLAELPDYGYSAQGVTRSCQALTRKGTPCQRQPLAASEYCPSHQHLTESFEELGVGELGLEPLELAA
jgi:hypothetical protein